MSVSAYPPADLDRRFYAFAIDRLVAWPIYGVAGWLAWRLFWSDGAVGSGLGLLAAVVLVVWLVFAALLGVQGSSPGKSLMGLRVERAEAGTPPGFGPALVRTALLGLATLPTFGLGVATLAQTAVTDRSRQRRGWHDQVAHTVVVDVRPPEEREPAVPQAPQQVVNLTAMRLAPTPPPAPTPVPQRRPAPRPEPAPPTPPIVLPPGAPPGRTPLPSGPPPSVAESSGRTAPRSEPTPDPPSDADRTVVRGTGGPAPAGGGWRVSFDHGESFVVQGLALVGRRPEGRPGEPVRHVVPLASEDLSVSKTHAQIQVAADGVLVVMDRGSTNGSVLVRSGVSRELPPGRPTTLLEGDEVRFGDRSMSVARES